MYTSRCYGEVSADDYEVLLNALSEKGFKTDSRGFLYANGYEFTGFYVNYAGRLVGYSDADLKTYGFEAFVKALIQLSDLIRSADLVRQGEECGDREYYSYYNGQWYKEIRTAIVVLAPIDHVQEIQRQADQWAEAFKPQLETEE